VDAVFDCVDGRAVTIVAFGEEVEPGRWITHRAFSARVQRRKLEKLSEMLEAGKVRVEIEDVLPLEEAAKAYERVEAGHTRGKIMLRVG
jgi:NADPH:quinone reductase-like Zn-dependent oxidoreductase